MLDNYSCGQNAKELWLIITGDDSFVFYFAKANSSNTGKVIYFISQASQMVSYVF